MAEIPEDIRGKLKQSICDYVKLTEEYEDLNEQLKELSNQRIDVKSDVDKYLTMANVKNLKMNLNEGKNQVIYRTVSEYSGYSQKFIHTKIHEFFEEHPEFSAEFADELIEFIKNSRRQTTKTRLTVNFFDESESGEDSE